MDEIAYVYLPEANPRQELFLPGVPLRSLTVEDVLALPAYLQRSVAASPLYTATDAAPVLPEEEVPTDG